MKPRNLKKLHAFVSRGPNAGRKLYPHVHEDGQLVVSKTRFETDYIRVGDETAALTYLAKGFKLRMSNIADKITSPSLVSPKNIFRPIVF